MRSRRACQAGSSGCGRSSCGARSRGSRTGCRLRPTRRRSSRGSRGTPTSRSVADRRATRPTSGSRSSTTRRDGTTTPEPRPPRSCRGIQLFHVQGNGWNDIGYNFLVDRFGTVYEGRFGGTDRNVVGAHARGFNTGSVGIALLGSYSNATPSVAAQDAIARVIAWRLDLAHVDPASFLTFISGGSERYASGIPVLLRAVSGHRDTGFTECPGDRLYGGLNSIAGAARALGGLKVFEPLAERSGSLVRLRAKLSAPQPWTVAITNSARVEVARGAGAGSLVDWTWDSAGTPAGNYTWTIASGDARPASGCRSSRRRRVAAGDRDGCRRARGDQPER